MRKWLFKYKKIISAALFLLTIVIAIYGWHKGIFTSSEQLGIFLQKYAVAAPIVFILIQIIQVVFPIIPGGLGCLGGVLIFGPIKGFIYNYIGICIGSVFAFLLGRQYGRDFIRKITGEKFYDKYSTYLTKPKGFDRVFATLIFLPVAPDDFLCYLAGISEITLKKFTFIILLGKPLAIFLYSMGLSTIFQFITA